MRTWRRRGPGAGAAVIAVMLGVAITRLLTGGSVTEPAARPTVAAAETPGAGAPAPYAGPDPFAASTTTSAAPPTTAPAPPTTAGGPAPARATPPAGGASRPAARPGTSRAAAVPGSGAFGGLGTWLDVYDWSATFTNGKPQAGPDDVDRMAAAGVQTLYVQTARPDTPEDVLERDRLAPIIARARAKGLSVVGWFLPGLTDPAADLRHLVAISRLGVQGVAVDIESRDVADVAERNRRLVDLSAAVRRALPGMPLGGIVLPPVVTEVVNTNYWPAFPWHGIAPSYDVWLTMGYWTNRTGASGYRDAYRYTTENVRRLRSDLGLAGAKVHAIGGIADATSAADDDAFVRAVKDAGAIGGSLYDWRTTGADEWPRLRSLRG